MNLTEARKNARYSQEAVAGYLGISRPTYAKMEASPDMVTVEDAKKLSRLFGVNVEDLFFNGECN
jgi:DNA-binding XRE family transcriptional regulator